MQNLKPLSSDNKTCLGRPTPTDLNPDELCHYPFRLNLDGCDGSCNSLTGLSDRTYIQNKTEVADLKIFNKVARTNKSKSLV